MPSYFNSRPSARGDCISIHAPPRGAFQFTPLREGRRLTRFQIKPAGFDFNSRPSARGDECREELILIALQFQFTPLREGRQGRNQGRRQADYFNSRPSARGDGYWCIQAQRGLYFNSRPSARGDQPKQSPDSAFIAFQFTPLREGRLLGIETETIRFKHFNSRPSARGDTTLPGISPLVTSFQFTPLREGRLRAGSCGLASS